MVEFVSCKAGTQEGAACKNDAGYAGCEGHNGEMWYIC